MKNYCTSFFLYSVINGKSFLCGSAFTKATLRKRAKKLGLSWYCIETLHTENLISIVVKTEYFYD